MAALASGPPTRPTLIWRIRNAQDHEAWKEFVRIYTPLIFGHCLRKGLQPADAEDVTQDVFTKVSQAIGKFDYRPEKGRFRAWLGKVVASAIRRSQSRPRQLDGWADMDVDSPLDVQEARAEDSAWTEEFSHHIYQTALARVRPCFEEQSWQIFELLWCHDLPPVEVARRLGLSLESVFVAKHRVLKRLQQEVLHLAEDSALFVNLSSSP